MKKVFIIQLLLAMSIQLSAGAYTMTYMYGGTTTTYKNYAQRAAGIINAVSPDYFDLVEGGALSCPKLSHDFVDTMHQQGISVIPLISNHWDKANGVATLENTEAITDQIAAKVIEYNIDGVNVDIQNVNHLYKDAYTNFVKRMRDKLPGRSISVAVAANPNGWTTGWHGSYDYEKLAQNSDFLMIMAYDESWYGSSPGPVASYSFLKRSIDYALKYTTADKVVAGIPLYGRYWKAGAAIGGNALTQKDVESLLQSYNSTKQYISDTNVQSAKVSVVIGQDDTKPTLWGGRTLDAGEYEIWYDDAQSVRTKLELSREYGLRGTGTWAIGQEHESVWETYADFLAVSPPPSPTPIQPSPGLPTSPESVFGDTSNHWAKTSIDNVALKGWIKGKENGMFEPDAYLTRAEGAVVIVRSADVPTSPYSNDFLDTGTHWARQYIADLRYYGIVQGDDNNMFYPDNLITREEFAVMIDRVFNLTATVDFSNNPYTDVNHDLNPWSYEAIIKLSENGILFGYEDKFRPKNVITRAEMAAIMDRISGSGTKPREQVFMQNKGITEDLILPR